MITLTHDNLIALDNFTDAEAGKIFKALKAHLAGRETSLEFPLSMIFDHLVKQTPVCSQASESPAQHIFSYWVRLMNKNINTKFTPKRKRLIEARLKQGYTAAEIKLAIDGCARSSWHMGDNPESKTYNCLTLICRDGDHLESFIENASNITKQEQQQAQLAAIRRGSIDLASDPFSSETDVINHDDNGHFEHGKH